MATKKITELTAANTLSGNSLLVAVTDPAGAATTRKITVANFLGNVTTNTVYNANVTLNANTTANNLSVTFANTTTLNVNTGTFVNTLIIPYRSTPANSTAISISNNAIFHDGNFLYVAVGNNITKRATLSTF
jgi:hypothetical protein